MSQMEKKVDHRIAKLRTIIATRHVQLYIIIESVARQSIGSTMCNILMSVVGYPPHSVKLNTIMCHVCLTAKHPSNDGRSPTPGLGTPHWVKLNSITCYEGLTTKHLSNDGMPSTLGLGTPPLGQTQ